MVPLILYSLYTIQKTHSKHFLWVPKSHRSISWQFSLNCSWKGLGMRVLAFFSGELIVSRYVAESITMCAVRFGHIGLCQLLTKRFCTQLTMVYMAKTSCNYCYYLCYISAHNQLAQYWQSSNEPLRHYCPRRRIDCEQIRSRINQ